jgi:protein deglycase
MPKVAVLLANGFEEIEAVTIVDVLRRAGVEAIMVALRGASVVGSHDIEVTADCTFSELRAAELDGVVLPGGMPGAATLRDDERVAELLRELTRDGKLVSAICAAPMALDAAGVLVGRRATAYPDTEVPTARLSTDPVVEDGNIVTSRGVGTALEFALTLVRRLVGEQVAVKLRGKLLVDG